MTLTTREQIVDWRTRAAEEVGESDGANEYARGMHMAFRMVLDLLDRVNREAQGGHDPMCISQEFLPEDLTRFCDCERVARIRDDEWGADRCGTK